MRELLGKVEGKRKLRELHRREEVHVDSDTGEVMGVTTHVVKVQSKNPQDFMFLFRSGVDRLVGLSGVAVKVYLWCGVGAQMGKGVVVLDATERQAMMVAIGCSASAVQKSLKELLAGGLLTRRATGRYELVMEHAWRGKAGGRTYTKEQQGYGVEKN